MGDRLEIFTLGGLRILQGGAPVSGLNNRKAEALLVYLASTRRPQPREVLAEMLWDDRTESQAMGNLRVLFTILRQALGDFLIITREDARINPAALVWMDALELEDGLCKLPAQGKLNLQTAPQAARSLALYQGNFLSGFSISDCLGFQAWQAQESERLHWIAVDGYAELVAYNIERGEYQLGIVHATRLLELEPLMETAHRQMMLLLARCNQRKAALDQYAFCKKLLQMELGVDPEEETRFLYERILDGKFEIKAAASPALISLQEILDAPTHNIPLPLTTFIGREEHIKKVTGLLASSRLLTLTGCGGIGKTRLALEVCNRLLQDYLHGVWLVELSGLTEEGQVIPALASALRISLAPERPEIDAVVDSLRNKRLLLVLDTCEHVIQACASAVIKILEHAPQVQVLATSREPLGISGETLFHVQPLTLPGSGQEQGLEDGGQYEAVQLFVERARAVSLDFSLTPVNAVSIARLCRRLDGIPLALELAAARIQFISVEQINSRLSDAFRLLSGGSRAALLRHQTLRAAIDWSYTLLSEPECLLFNRLSVLVGNWELEAAESICCDEGPTPITISQAEVFDLLSSLVRKSMVVAQSQEGSETRYRLLDTIRQYTEIKLQESGETAAFRRRHWEYFTRWAETAEKKLHGPEQLAWSERSEANKENFTVAFYRAMESDPQAALHLGVALGSIWMYSSHDIEGIYLLEKALNKPENVTQTLNRARALILQCGLQYTYRSLWDQALEALEIFVEQRDVIGQAQAHRYLGYCAVTHHHDLTKAKQHLEEGVRLFRAVGNRWWEAKTYRTFFEIYEALGDILSARQVEEQCYQIFHELKDELEVAISIYRLAYLIGEYEGNLSLGRMMYEQALALFVKYNKTALILGTAEVLACLALWQGDFAFLQSLMAKVNDCYKIFEIYINPIEVEMAGRSLALQGMYQHAIDHFQHSIDQAAENFLQGRESKDDSFYKNCEVPVLVYVYTNLKQFDQAKKYLTCLDDNVYPLNSRKWQEGLIAFYEGEAVKTLHKFQGYLEFVNHMNYRMGVLMGVEGCAGGLYLLGRHLESVQCLASASAYRKKIGAPVWPGDQGFHERVETGLVKALGADTYQEYWRAGEAMELDQAVTVALSGD
jgi:predicted ATPase/DNA-binding SARP family transcriptional activator